MQYLIVFLEGIITFISPCHLPMLPVYISYFAANGENSAKKTFFNALGFVSGFTSVFILMGAFAATLGAFLQKYHHTINIITGIIVILFGLNLLGVFNLKHHGSHGKGLKTQNLKFWSSMALGCIFAVSWTPCVSAFLGSALMLAASSGTTLKGVVMLFIYSLGLGIPFIMSAMIIDKLKNAFNAIKSHYGAINKICGVMLIVLGIVMATGIMGGHID